MSQTWPTNFLPATLEPNPEPLCPLQRLLRWLSVQCVHFPTRARWLVLRRGYRKTHTLDHGTSVLIFFFFLLCSFCEACYFAMDQHVLSIVPHSDIPWCKIVLKTQLSVNGLGRKPHWWSLERMHRYTLKSVVFSTLIYSSLAIQSNQNELNRSPSHEHSCNFQRVSANLNKQFYLQTWPGFATKLGALSVRFLHHWESPGPIFHTPQ